MGDRVGTGRFQPLSIEIQAELAERHGLTTLMCCTDAWALRHRFINRETGETVRARCGSWSCLYCGPRKVDMWRQLVKEAEPTLFVTLTRVGKTLKEAARVLTTVLQYIRRGSKGRGKDKIGVRPAYPIQVFAVLEEHSDMENVGFHWHLLVKGVDYLPKKVLEDALRSATHSLTESGVYEKDSYIVHVERIRKKNAIGYVTKYLMKEIAREQRGMVEEERVVSVMTTGEQGQVVETQETRIVERLCKAHRIRYSKSFFPERTADLRRRLFGEKEEKEESQEQTEGSDGKRSCQVQGSQEQDESQRGEEAEQEVPSVPRSVWVLHEVEPFIDDKKLDERRKHATLLGVNLPADEDETSLQAYRRRRRKALLEALVALREGKRLYSRRVISLWSYQRGQLRLAG